MDIKYLRYFNEIIKEGNMTRAAGNLNIAQPALSATINRMEKELDIKLFEKDGRNIIPSTYAAEILPYFENILIQYDAAIQKIANMKNPHKHHLQVAVTGMAFPYPLLLAFRRTYPDIVIKQTIFHPDQLGDIFYNDQIDYIISAYPFSNKRLISKTLWQEKILVAVPKQHRFAFRQSLSISELRNENFIMLPPGNAFRILCEKMCADSGFIPVVTMECFPGQTRALVSAGFGVSFMTSTAIQAEKIDNDGVQAIPLTDITSVRSINILWRVCEVFSVKSVLQGLL